MLQPGLNIFLLDVGTKGGAYTGNDASPNDEHGIMRILIASVKSGLILNFASGKRDTMTERDAAEGHEFSSGMKELTEARNRLRESEEEFRRILCEIPISMSIISPEGEVVLVNKTALSLLDAEGGADFRGGFDISDIWDDPKQRDEWLGEIRSRGGIVSDYEIEVITLTGVHKILLLSGLMITYDGRPCILSVHQDITEKKKAEADLRKSREKYRSLVENLNEILFVIDTKGRITYLTPNISSIIGYAVPELIGKYYTAFVHPDDRAERSKEFHSVLLGNECPKDYRILKKEVVSFGCRRGGVVRWSGTGGK